ALEPQRSVRARHTVRRCGDRIGKAGIPEEPALGVMDEIAIVRKLYRHADIDAGRPARLIGCRCLAAIKDVELVNTRRGSGKRAERDRASSQGNARKLHDLPSSCVIASQRVRPEVADPMVNYAKQSSRLMWIGLLRRFAPRNDEHCR